MSQTFMPAPQPLEYPVRPAPNDCPCGRPFQPGQLYVVLNGQAYHFGCSR
jgi:hypothetical protein